MDDITVWIQRLADGDSQAEQMIWNTFFSRLVRLARNRLRSLPHSAADEEDMALSALGSFYRGLAGRKFPQLNDRHDLWKLLATLTIRKTIAHGRRELAIKRGGGQIRQAATGGSDDDSGDDRLKQLISDEPAPELVVSMSETCNNLLAELEDDTLRDIARRKLEGYSNEEIAESLGCAVRTVERKLARIRQMWEQHDRAAG